MFYIFIKIPFFKHSDSIFHLIEHCAIGETTQDNFFQNQNIRGYNNIGYTYFVLDSKSRNKLNILLKQIQKTLSDKQIKYEHNIIKKECEEKNYEKKLLCYIGKILYEDDFIYSDIGNLDYKTIHKYHKKYYKSDNILILEDNKSYFNGKITSKLFFYRKIHTNILKEKSTTYVIKHGAIELFIIFIIMDLLDNYIDYTGRFINNIYYTKETTSFELNEYICLSINNEHIKLIKNIPTIFIKNFISDSMIKKYYLKDKTYDGSCLLKYGYTLSNKQKKEIIKEINKYYNLFISQM